MDDERNWSIAYLAARGDAPWRWADDGDVIAWANGTTIAFRGEVAFILEWLIPHGWPPFGALVWLLAACRGKLPPALVAGDVPRPAPQDQAADDRQLPLSDFHDRMRALHPTVEAGLAAVARLPEALRNSPKAKAVLAETVFVKSRAEAGQQALLRAVVATLRSGALTDTMLNDPGLPPELGKGEFTALHDGLRELSAESLALRLRTGLDALPHPATLPLTPAARLRAMLAELRTDPEYAGLARLTRDFMAALQLPRALSEPDELPVGGFADLSNRGNLDRLLLSELAHDDLTLAVRIALQEALYLRREPPAKQPPSTLAVLLDSGVRLWGVPRLLATAVALALIGKSVHHGALAVFRAHGDELAPLDLLTREGLAAHLAVLDSQAHPGRALPAFHRALADAGQHDAVLITQRDVANDPAFRRSLLDVPFRTLYLAVVDRDGRFELRRHPPTAAPLCVAQIDVDDLFPASLSPGKAPAGLLDRAAHPELPLIFSTQPFPLLLPVHGHVQMSVKTEREGGLCVLRDRRLMQWDELYYGARMIAAELPHGSPLWLGQVSGTNIGVLKMSNGRRSLAYRIFGPDGTPVHSHDWHFAEPVQRADAFGELLLIFGPREVRVYDRSSSEQRGTVPIPQQYSCGGYFRTDGRWQALYWDGQNVKFEPIHPPGLKSNEEVVWVFDNRRVATGPWWVTRAGNIFSPDGRCVLKLGPIRDFVSVGPDGERLLVRIEKSGHSLLVDLYRLTQRVVTGTWKDHAVAPPRPPDAVLRARFKAMIVSPGRIQLLTQKHEVCWEIDYERDPRLVLKKEPGPRAGSQVGFESIKIPGAAGCSLKVAAWPDGRRAWLDDRGMLHLRCADRRQPEVSIVLAEPALAAWSSDGLWCGPKFFIGTRETSPVPELWKRILAFTAE